MVSKLFRLKNSTTQCSKQPAKSIMKHNFLNSALLLVCGSVNSALADDTSWTDRLQLHGFLTQGYINTNHNNWFGDSEDGSFEFTEVGLNTRLQLTSNLSASAQVLSRRAGEMDNGSPHLDYGFFSYQLFESRAGELGFRVGRIKNKFGLYNDTRDVAATRPGVFMPQSIYFDRVRNVLLSSDGVSAFGGMNFDNSSITFNVNVGKFPTDKNIKATFIGENLPGSLDSDEKNVTSSLLYEYDAGRIRIALSNVNYTLRFNAQPGPIFSDGYIDGDIRILSAEYNAERWSFTAEYSRQPIYYNDISPVFETLDGEAEAYYVQALHRFSNRWSSWLRYEASFRDKDDKSGKMRGPASGQPPHSTFTKSWVAGVRWDVSRNLMVSAEYHRNDGTFILSRVDNPPSTPTDPEWDIFALLVSYRF